MIRDPREPRHGRRRVIEASGVAAVTAALVAGFGISPARAAEMAEAAGRSAKPLNAAFSNAGLQATWCAQGKRAAEHWGTLFNVEVTWFDGELSATKQRAAIDNMASRARDAGFEGNVALAAGTYAVARLSRYPCGGAMQSACDHGTNAARR